MISARNQASTVSRESVADIRGSGMPSPVYLYFLSSPASFARPPSPNKQKTESKRLVAHDPGLEKNRTHIQEGK